MSGEAFIFNDPPGSFILKRPDGVSAFDSRLATYRIHKTGVAEVQGPANMSVQFTTLFVPYNKTFTKIPYVRSVSRLIDNQSGNVNLAQYKDYWPPNLGWSQVITTGQEFFGGTHTHALLNGLYIGNDWQSGAPRGRIRAYYAIFENPVQ